jgi:hypothetical protein
MAVAEALGRVFLQQAQDDGFGLRRHFVADRARSGGRRTALHLEQRLAITRAKRQLPGEHLEEQHA